MTASERKLVRESVAYVLEHNEGHNFTGKRKLKEALAILDAEDKAGGFCPKCKGTGKLWAGLGNYTVPCKCQGEASREV
jgi:hypothetical protein